MTGQDLTHDKMIGKEPLTEEEQKKYPYVIDPFNQLQATHLSKFNMEDPYEKAVYGLILASKKIAPSEKAYEKTPARFDGYFFDKELDAIEENSLADDIYEAETLVRHASLETHRHIATMLNYFIKGDFYIAVANISPDLLKNKLFKACKEHPEDVKKCFPKYNKGIEKFQFVLEAISNNLIRETQHGEFFYEQEHLGSSIEDVIAKLQKYEGRGIRQILESKIAKIKSGIPIDERESDSDFQARIKDLKVFIVDKQAVAFEDGLKQLYKDFPYLTGDQQYADEMDMLDKHLKVLKGDNGPSDKKEEKRPETKLDPEKELEIKKKNLRTDLEKKDLEALQVSVKHHMTPYKEEDCEDVWNDRDKLIDYMINTKLSDVK